MADIYLKGFTTKEDRRAMKHDNIIGSSTSYGYVYDHNVVSTMREVAIELRRVLKTNPNAQIVVEVK